jgi:carboxyl-terminal processing protease
MQKKISIFWTVIICLFAILVTFMVTFLFMNSLKRQAEADLAESYKESLDELEDEYLAQFASINEMYASLPDEIKSTELFMRLAYLDTYYRALYVGKIDEEKLTYYLASGYIQGVGDKYGEYYTADDLQSFMDQAYGKMYGIGVTAVYSPEYDAIEILSVTEGSPADKAGMLVGDIITHVEGERVSRDNYYASINKIKGDKGTQINLTIWRNGTELPISAIRDEIKITSVSYHKYALDSKIGIVRISEFNDGTTGQLKSALEALKADGVSSIVFDMRNNPGGTLDSVIDILDYLLPEGDLCYVYGADGTRVATYKSDANQFDSTMKMAVLINENTASAAELFTAALRDYNRATVVGVTSFGKGSMQTTYQLPNGEGIKLSTNTYNPPCDVNYNGIGITPSIVVELDEALKNKSFYKITDEEDNQLLEACRCLGYNN